jgi:hypothetical protein
VHATSERDATIGREQAHRLGQRGGPVVADDVVHGSQPPNESNARRMLNPALELDRSAAGDPDD